MAIILNYDKNAAIRIRDFLLSQGLTLEGTYGMMANIYTESGFRSNNAQNSCMTKLGMTDETYTVQVDNGQYTAFCTDRVGYGLCQWTSSGRKTGLFNYAKNQKLSIGDETMQLNYLVYELSTAYKLVFNKLKTSHDISECAKYVMLKFERPANQSEENQNKRASYGLQLYKELENKKEETNMGKPIIALSAGHGLYTAGKRCKKSIDPNETREWYLNDRIIDKVETKLLAYNCTVLRVNDTTGKTDTALKTRTNTANNANADVYLAMHHNAGIHGGKGGGTVVYYYSTDANRKTQATQLYNAIVAQTGLVGNRSSKVIKKNYHEVREPKMLSLLVENGFMDSKTDVPIILTEEHAEKTAIGVVNFLVSYLGLTKTGNVISSTTTITKPSTPANTTTYKVDKGDNLTKIGKKTGIAWTKIAKLNNLKFPYTLSVGQVLKLVESTSPSSTSKKFVCNGIDYSLVFDPVYYSNKYVDLKRIYGTNSTNLFNHFKNHGMKEGRQASANFNAIAYKSRYADLQKAFGNNLPEYYKHYIQCGKKEGRQAL